MNTGFIGKEYPPFTASVDPWRVGFFAHAIGDSSELYSDATAAGAAGYRDIPAPPTLPFSLSMDHNQSFMVLADLAIDITRAMHGEQSFRYHGDICSGDVLTGRQKVVDIYEKKGGALLFIVTETRFDNQQGDHVCDMGTTIVVRQG